MKRSSVIAGESLTKKLRPRTFRLNFSWFYSIRRFFKNVRRSLDYAVLGWGNYDWDYNFLLHTLRFKLDRMQKFLTGPNAIATHSSTALKSIRIAAKLAKKLDEDDYSFFGDQHRKKWQAVKVFEDVEPSEQERRAGIAKITRAINTPETATERKEFIRAADKDENIRKRDARWLFSIMEKHYTSWWD